MLAKLVFFISFIIQAFSIPFAYRYVNSLSLAENKVSKDVKKKMLDFFLIFDEELENNNRTDNRTHPKPDNRTDNRTHPKPDNRTDNRTNPRPDNRTDNRTDPKPDNRTDNRTDPKPDNRTDNRTEPKPDNRTDNRTDPKPDNRTDNRTDPKPDNRTDNRTDPKPDNRTDNKTYDIELVAINTKAIEYIFLQNISLVFTKNITNLKLLRSITVTRTKNKKLIDIPLMCDNYENDYIISCVGDFSSVQNGIYLTYSFEYNHTVIELETPITFYVQKRSSNLLK